MQYRHVAKTGWDVSVLSFGCMRFRDDDSAVAAVRRAAELGVNYFDVAPLYGGGTAERRLAAGIRGLRRETLILTAKSSPGNGGTGLCDCAPEQGFGIRTADEARRQIERSMTILGVDRLDMYQFWALHSDEVFREGVKRGGFLEGVLKARDEGLFPYIGMTTHSESADIIRYLKESPYEFDMVTLPFHLLNDSREEAVAYCTDRGIGVIAMNPLGGGVLARNAPIMRRAAQAAGAVSPAAAALRYTAGVPGMTTVLNGITLAGHAEEGALAVEAGPLAPEKGRRLKVMLTKLFRAVDPNRLCSACGYCGQCPMGIFIPKVLEAAVDLRIPELAVETRERIARKLMKEPEGWDPSLCTACGRCEEKCPNRLPVAQLMEAAEDVWPPTE